MRFQFPPERFIHSVFFLSQLQNQTLCKGLNELQNGQVSSVHSTLMVGWIYTYM